MAFSRSFEFCHAAPLSALQKSVSHNFPMCYTFFFSTLTAKDGSPKVHVRRHGNKLDAFPIVTTIVQDRLICFTMCVTNVYLNRRTFVTCFFQARDIIGAFPRIDTKFSSD
eukprot:gnl/MRDRNA2_/MRDRNA2_368711_c0_seq1.p1 gnl/MRDRNA2_/MRDRNA2_368711_c0~~gnl/MRDRNA2_/MRDRNA2_368711_c0_seq1.p1  ORF type:complete len:111 (+),score=15.42 gnl/MRDRNA2_/MRDRNA2_368711_c0_seq1:168-500(+)